MQYKFETTRTRVKLCFLTIRTGYHLTVRHSELKFRRVSSNKFINVELIDLITLLISTGEYCQSSASQRRRYGRQRCRECSGRLVQCCQAVQVVHCAGGGGAQLILRYRIYYYPKKCHWEYHIHLFD